MTFRAKWTIGMTAFGLLVAVVVLLLTDSVGWAVVGLLGAGVVANSLVHPGRGGWLLPGSLRVQFGSIGPPPRNGRRCQS